MALSESQGVDERLSAELVEPSVCRADFKAAAGLNPLHQSQPVKQSAHKRESGGLKGLPVKAGRQAFHPLLRHKSHWKRK